MQELSADNELSKKFLALVDVVAKLRGPNGCPWDKEQTPQSLVKFILEEAFEVAEAIESGNKHEICDELGDYLFQVILQAQIASENQQQDQHFDVGDVISSITEKMIRRHPHVFADVQVADSAEVKKNWEIIKAQEKSQNKHKPLFNYPKNLPALMAANKVGLKTANYGFDWHHVLDVIAKVEEELSEVKEALEEKNISHIEHEIGDLLFSVAQLARHSKLDPEHCLREANRRFQNRFEHVLSSAKQLHQIETAEQFTNLPDAKKEELWQHAKDSLRQHE